MVSCLNNVPQADPTGGWSLSNDALWALMDADHWTAKQEDGLAREHCFPLLDAGWANSQSA
jgi:hypothetical protein